MTPPSNPPQHPRSDALALYPSRTLYPSLALGLSLLALGLSPSAAAQTDTGPPIDPAAQTIGTSPLRLQDLLSHLSDQLPPLRAAAADIDKATAKHLATEGAFDLQMRAKTSWDPLGYYDPLLLDAQALQPLPWLGLSLYGGYRLGLGKIAVYDGKYDTLQGGEVYAGFELPLWRYRDTDPNRTARATAALDISRAEANASLKRIAVLQKARLSYWKWVASTYKLELAEEMLRIAQTRAAATARQISRGAAADILQADADRVVFERDTKRIEAEQALREAAFQLSLYLRDPTTSSPSLPTRALVPHDLPPLSRPPAADLDAHLADAFARRPELSDLSLRRRQLEAEIQLADNGLAPKINLFGIASQDMGGHPDPAITPTKEPFELRAGLSFEWTLQRRAERGKRDALEAELVKLDADLQWAQEQIAVEVRSTFTAIQAAHDQYTLALQLSQNAQTLADAELRRFDLGASTLFTIYLREQSVIQARLTELDAWLNYQAAIALHAAAAALDLPPP